MDVQCLKCKGRGHCGRSFCPLVTKAEALYKVKQNLKKDFSVDNLRLIVLVEIEVSIKLTNQDLTIE